MWNSPFNKIVRSKEAMIIGLLVGLVIGGAIGGFLTTTVVQHENYNKPVKLCDKLKNVDTVNFYFHGVIKQVKCKDGRTFRL